MSWKRWTAAAVLSVQLPAISSAKPADLPVDLRINHAATPAAMPVVRDAQPTCPASDRAIDVFQRAERQRLQGQLDDARRGYEETHLLAPMSRVGQQAIDRLRDLLNPGNHFSEEQEPPLSRSAYRPEVQPRPESNRRKPTRNEYLDLLRETEPLEIEPHRPTSY